MRAYVGLGILTLLLSFASCDLKKPGNAAGVKRDTLMRIASFNDSDTIVLRNKEYHLLAKLFSSANKKGFNGNVLVAKKGKIIYRDSWGYADFSKKQQLSNSSRFQLASVSKQFTAIGIMLLQEQGKLSYLDPVQKFLPDFPYPNINIHLLLSHRSGLPNYTYFCDHFCKNRETPITNSEVLQLMSEKKPEAYFKPDKRFQYNNTNYCVLASIIEKVSGMSYREFVHKNLLEPAGMRETEVFSSADQVEIPYSVKGHYANGRYVKYNYLNGVVGDKGMYSTITDLFLWDKALSSGKILKRETLEQAFLPTSDIRKNGSSYGYGYRLRFLEDSTKIVFHGGWWQGFKSCYMKIPKDDILIVVLTNVANHGFSMGLLLDAYSLVTPGFTNPYASQISSRDSLSF